MGNKKTTKSKKSFWQDGLSINEAKVSVLIICLVISVVFAGINYWRTLDISNNFTVIIQSFIWSIAGINMVDKASGFFNSKPNRNMNNQENQNYYNPLDSSTYQNYDSNMYNPFSQENQNVRNDDSDNR